MENSLPKTVCLLCCKQVQWDISTSLDRRKVGVETLTKLFCLKINIHTEDHILKLLQGPKSSLKNFSFCSGCFNKIETAVELQLQLDILKNEVFRELLKGKDVVQQVTKIRAAIQECANTYFTLVGTDSRISADNVQNQTDINVGEVSDLFPNSENIPDIIRKDERTFSIIRPRSLSIDSLTKVKNKDVSNAGDGPKKPPRSTSTTTTGVKLVPNGTGTNSCSQEPRDVTRSESRASLNIHGPGQISCSEQNVESDDDIIAIEVEDPLRLDVSPLHETLVTGSNNKKIAEIEVDPIETLTSDDSLEEDPFQLGQDAMDFLDNDVNVIEYEIEEHILEELEKQHDRNDEQQRVEQIVAERPLHSSQNSTGKHDQRKMTVGTWVNVEPGQNQSHVPAVVDISATIRESIKERICQAVILEQAENSSYKSTTTESADEDTSSDRTEPGFLEQPLSPQIPYPQEQLAPPSTQILEEHAYSINLNEDVILSIGPSASKRKAVIAQSHTCDLCDTSFSCEPELSLHIQDMHSFIPKDSHQWTCNACSEEFYAHKYRYVNSKKYYELPMASGRTQLFSTFVELCTFHDRACLRSSCSFSPLPERLPVDELDQLSASQAVSSRPSSPPPKKRKKSPVEAIIKRFERMQNDGQVYTPKQKQKSARTCVYLVMNGSFGPAKNALKDVVECYFCLMGFKSALVLALHLREDHWEQLDLPMQNALDFNCTRCGSIFDKLDGNIRGHLYFEVDTHLQSCYNATANCSANLTLKLRCPMCVEVFHDEATFMDHVYDHCEPVLGSHCDICEFRAGSSQRLTTHLYYRHGITRYREKYFFCFFCKKCYLSPNDDIPSGQLDLNSMDHFKSFAATHARCRAKGSFPPPKRLNCRKCPVKVDKMSTLFLHEDTQHWNRYLTTCVSCAETFGTLEKLQKHQSQVHQVPSIPCTVCGVQFLNMNCLQDHRTKFHLEAAWLNCEFCPASFLDRPSLKVHNSRMHKCRVCGQGFRTINLRSVHEKKVHEYMSDDVPD